MYNLMNVRPTSFKGKAPSKRKAMVQFAHSSVILFFCVCHGCLLTDWAPVKATMLTNTFAG
jgi:hypothetical protein